MADGAGQTAVRLAGPDDLPPVFAIEKACFSDPWTPVALLGELVPDALRMPLVVTVGDQIRGYLLAWRVADQLHILNIATDPGYQRRGLATCLLRAAARRAVAEALVEATLEVRASNRPARSFYSGHGFVATGLRRGYYSDNGEDAIIMTCGVARLLDDE